MEHLSQEMISNPYYSYIYAYPHKKSYREFDKPIPLKELWKDRQEKGLTFYCHIPFCKSRCGYCNLLSTCQYREGSLKSYVDKLVQEIKSVREFLQIENSNSPFSSVIFGGGTPTILSCGDLRRLLDAIGSFLNIDFKNTFFSMETSPSTLDNNKLRLLKEYHVDRISIGIQSFKANELNNIYRRESVDDIKKSLALLFKEDIKIRNIDLIYGIPSQTMETWEESLMKILDYEPEETYIYPLYIREKTKLYDEVKRNEPLMMKMYDFAQDFLTRNNYIQTSMRNFIRSDMKDHLFPKYGCQEDQMVGIGCGARSYINNIHYSRKYATDPKNINTIIEDYLRENDFNYASYGYKLNEDEQKRRYIIKSVLKVTGLDIEDYMKRFSSSPLEEYKILNSLIENDFIINKDDFLYPTEKGLRYSDKIGPLFVSDEVQEKIKAFIED